MTENQLYYGILGFYFLLIGPLVVWLFWVQHRKNVQDRAVAVRLKRNIKAEHDLMDSKYEEEMERRSGCFEERFEDEEDEEDSSL
jgi:hypothetical protein